MFYELTTNVKQQLDKIIKAQEIVAGLIDLIVECSFLYLFYQIGDESLDDPMMYSMFSESEFSQQIEQKKISRERSETEYFLEDPDL